MFKIRKSPKIAAICCVLLPAIFASTNSFAYKCEVKFIFVNKWKSSNDFLSCEIKVKKVAIIGPKGAWNENITNKKIAYGSTHVTSIRKLNKISLGETGTYSVIFDERCAGTNSAWISRTHGPFSFYHCGLGDIKFTIQH